MAPDIPDRWLDYKPIGERIEGTRFIAFKVPLREHITQKVDDEKCRLNDKILLKNVPSLGLIIDLTNTNRYYSPDIFQREGVKHQKLMIPGHITPPNHLVDRFKSYVLQFLDDNENNDKLIGVHCTHGVNRTGYLICNYMISELTVQPKEAIERFDKARGHKIERQNYISALYDLLGSSKSLTQFENDQSTAKIIPNNYEAERRDTKESYEFDRRSRYERFREEANNHRQYNNCDRSRSRNVSYGNNNYNGQINRGFHTSQSWSHSNNNYNNNGQTNHRDINTPQNWSHSNNNYNNHEQTNRVTVRSHYRNTSRDVSSCNRNDNHHNKTPYSSRHRKSHYSESRRNDNEC